MTTLSRIAATLLLPIASLAAFEATADTTYEFDSISSFIMGETPYVDGDVNFPNVTGVLRNSSTPTTVQFGLKDSPTGGLCVPMLLTMMEKPGRYYLTVRVQSPFALPNVGYLFNCGLVLRN